MRVGSPLPSRAITRRPNCSRPLLLPHFGHAIRFGSARMVAARSASVFFSMAVGLFVVMTYEMGGGPGFFASIQPALDLAPRMIARCATPAPAIDNTPTS